MKLSYNYNRRVILFFSGILFSLLGYILMFLWTSYLHTESELEAMLLYLQDLLKLTQVGSMFALLGVFFIVFAFIFLFAQIISALILKIFNKIPNKK